MKVGVSMWSYFRAWRDHGLDIPGFIRTAHKAGAEGVELLDFFYHDVGADYSKAPNPALVGAKRRDAMRALEETGLPVPIFSVAQNFAKVDPAEREIQLEKVRFGIDEAVLYGAKVVRVFAGDVSPGISFDQARAWIVEGLAAASAYAAEMGVKLALENHGHLAGRSEQVLGLIQDVRSASGNDALGANPDTGNFILVDQPSHEAVKEVAPYAYMVHFKDFKATDDPDAPFISLAGNRFWGAAVGEGTVNLSLCIAELKSAGFNGWLSVEYEGEEDCFNAVPRCLANTKNNL